MISFRARGRKFAGGDEIAEGERELGEIEKDVVAEVMVESSGGGTFEGGLLRYGKPWSRKAE